MFLDKLSLKGRLQLFTAVFSGLFLLFGLVSQHLTSRVKVGGPISQKIQATNDMYADILPPPKFLVETHMNSLEALTATPADLENNITTFQRLKSEYAARQDYWKETPLSDDLNREMVADTHEAAQRYFEAAERDFFPALKSGQTDKAKEILAQQLSPLFYEHKKKIVDLVGHLDSFKKQLLENSNKALWNGSWGLGILGLLMLAGMTAFSWVTAESIGKSVKGALSEVRHTAQEMTSVSQQMAQNSETTSSEARAVSTAAETVSASAQTVATSAEEMSASINEIAKNTQDASRVANEAVTTAKDTNDKVSKLGESSAQIGQVINVITSIAQQTDLLALNATIEAARAGEAGKGFAVVANEVKDLAKETSRATEDIRQKIETIQVDTKDAVAAIQRITQIITQINDIQSSIASAVEEQTAVTNEISRGANTAATGSKDIATNIGRVAQAAQETTSGANLTQTRSEDLQRLADNMGQLLGLLEQSGLPLPQGRPIVAAPARKIIPRVA